MALVETVTGPVDSQRLGRTYMHEHVFVLSPEGQQNYPGEWDEDVRVADAIAKLRALAEAGIDTIVDPTVMGLGRFIPRIQRIAESVADLNIVVATGCYTWNDVPFFFYGRTAEQEALLGRPATDPMIDYFVNDITEGIANTGVKAGMLKCAIHHQGMTGGVERAMRAVAKVHRLTGVPITIHTYPASQQGLAVQRLLDDEGVDPCRVVLAHSGDSTDPDHLEELAREGFVLGMDRFGSYLASTLQTRADIVIELCRRGLAEQMVLSHDASCYNDWLAPGAMELRPDWHYLHIVNEVVPYLIEMGVSQAEINVMLVDTPRRILEPSTPY